MRVSGLKSSASSFPIFLTGAMDRARLAAGIVFECDGRVLLLKRSDEEENYPGHWALPGGKAEIGETAEQAAVREAREEAGYLATDPLVEVSKVETPTGMVFHTFHCVVKDKFTPTLNPEHTAFRWVKRDKLPEPIHPQVSKTLKNIPVSVQSAGQPDLAEYFGVAMDRAPEGIDPRVDKMGRGGMPYDNKSVRTKDDDGRLHVSMNNISKAGVNPYLGSEIPHHQDLGLDPKKIYKLFRAPEELEKAAPTFHRQPLLSRHVPVSAKDPQTEIIVGTVGSDAVYDHPYLKSSLTVWTQDGIDAVESEEQKELSSAYHYEADMTPGEYEGTKYDGVMRNIRGNHVALVKTGRAGSDVVVGDSALPNQNGEVKMSKMMTRKASVAAGALMVTLRPLLAQDSTIDLGPILSKAKPGKFGAAKSSIMKAFEKALSSPKVKLAQDSDLAEVIEAVSDVIDAIDGNKDIVDDTEVDPNTVIKPDTALDAGPVEKAQEYLRSAGVSDEIIAGLVAAMNDGATDEDPDKKDDEDEGKGKKAPPFGKKDGDDKKPAMDSAAVTKIVSDAVSVAEANTVKRMNAISEAREHVRPVVGQIAMDAATPADVYRGALTHLGVADVEKLHETALRPVYDATVSARPKANSTTKVVAMDSAGAKDFATRFPGTENIRIA